MAAPGGGTFSFQVRSLFPTPVAAPFAVLKSAPESARAPLAPPLVDALLRFLAYAECADALRSGADGPEKERLVAGLADGRGMAGFSKPATAGALARLLRESVAVPRAEPFLGAVHAALAHKSASELVDRVVTVRNRVHEGGPDPELPALLDELLAALAALREPQLFSPGALKLRAGYRYRAMGENIAGGQTRPEDAVTGWIDSPGHCANLMNPAFTEMGVAVAVNRKSRMGVYWTLEFGTPR